MEVQIDNRQSACEISLKKIRQTAKVILGALDCPDGEISILIVDDIQIEKLNRKYFDRSGPTNVIAFPMREGEFSHLNPQILGDVARNCGMSVEQRFKELLVHGILHLFGYDHIVSEQDARKMEIKSQELLELI